jgi:hypothetical protein
MPDKPAPRRRLPSGAPELIVVTKPQAGLRSRGATVSAAPGVKVGTLNTLIKSRKIALRPLFDVSEERAQARVGAVVRRAAPDALDVSTFYFVEAPARNLSKLADDLLNEPAIEAAYVKPGGEPPEWFDKEMGDPPNAPENLAPAPTPDFNARQGYLDAAPVGVDARFAWTKPGGKGSGVRVIDLEWGWNFSHEDLLQNQGGIVGGSGATDTDHGTCVIGEISGDHNGLGIMGIAPDATISAVAFSMATATAIRMAADRLSAGDVMLLEIHRPGPRFNYQSRSDQRGYIAIEWWPDDFAAILYATGRGVLVVEAAGNGAENLDDVLYNTRPAGFPSAWRNPFNRVNPQCGAILCGAGAPPPGTHGRNHGADRSRLDFSNYGACIDAQGWGREVTTTGRSWGSADLYNGGTNGWYTDQFSGTSSASPIVTGVLASAQGMARAGGKPVITPARARDLLRSTGSPQQDEPTRPATQRIGNRPNLRAIHGQLFPKTAVKDAKDTKDLVKEHKEVKEKVEIKEHKDTKEKPEIKEHKELIKEHKELTKEHKELTKEHKELTKEHKELTKEHKEFAKEIKEKDKDIFEGGGFGHGIGDPTAAAGVEGRLTMIEQRLAELTHFIDQSLRPDLTRSALSGESDASELQALSDELTRQADHAKQAKDAKDVEKLRDA